MAPKLTDSRVHFASPKGAKKIEFLQLTAEAGKPQKSEPRVEGWVIEGGKSARREVRH